MWPLQHLIILVIHCPTTSNSNLLKREKKNFMSSIDFLGNDIQIHVILRGALQAASLPSHPLSRSNIYKQILHDKVGVKFNLK